MIDLLKKLRQKVSKLILFGIYGAVGCLIAALVLGEIFLALTKLPPSVQQTNHAVILVIDSSSSMGGRKLNEVKSAATSFVERQDLAQNRLGVVEFGSSVTRLTSLTNNIQELKTAIALIEDSGSTPMAEGINLAVSELNSITLNPSILLFTDGQPDSTFQTTLEAQAANSQNINLIAVATGDADVNFLSRLTGDRTKVFYANSGEFDRAFRDAEAQIYGRQLTESGVSGDYGLVYGSLRTGGWTAILAMGISLVLIVGQNQYMHRRLLSPPEAGISIGGGLMAGLVAGGVGQLLFLPSLSSAGAIEVVINWTLITTLLAGLISFKSNDLKSNLIKGSVAGAFAGLIPLLIRNSFAMLISAIILGVVFSQISKSKKLGWIVGIGVLLFGQLLFFSIPGLSTIDIFGRVLGWTILGALVGSGTSFYVPNLQLKRAALGGAIGGSLGAIGFLITAAILGDILGRSIGAIILGFCIGLTIAWAEKKQLITEDYLVVYWTPQEQTKILLGTKPITLGSSYEAQIHLSKAQGFHPIVAKIYKEDSNIVMQYDDEYAEIKGMKKLRHELNNGDRRKLGNITIEVKSSI